MDTILGLQNRHVDRGDYPVTYDVQMKDTRVTGGNMEERFKNAYLSQIQYYLNQVWVKIVGVPADIDIGKIPVPPEVHGGTGEKTIKQLIMDETIYIKKMVWNIVTR